MSETTARQASAYSSFESWVAQEEISGSFTDPGTAATYRSIWHAWLLWLPAGVSWREATQEHVTSFLDGPAPGTGRKRRPKKGTAMANATRYRYWRVLRAVYFHAHKEGKLSGDNPTLLGADEPGQEPDTREAQVMPPRVLELLRDPVSLALLLPSKSEQSQWWELRDRAAIGLLAHCALTTAELIELTGADLVEGPGPMRGVVTPPLPGVPAPEVQVRVKGSRKGASPRNIDIPAALVDQLRAWLRRREQVLQEDTNRLLLAGIEPADIPRVVNYPLFMSRQRAKPNQPLPPMEPQSIYLSVRSCLSAAYKHPDVQGRVAEDAYVARGAAIIRNTVIAEWIRHFGENEAVQRAGLRSAHSLRVPRRSTAKGQA